MAYTKLTAHLDTSYVKVLNAPFYARACMIIDRDTTRKIVTEDL